MKFHLGDIISISHECLVSPSGIDGVYKILNYMTRDNLFTHQLPRAIKVCGPILFNQLPFLKDIIIAKGEVTPENHVEWLANKVSIYGLHHEVKPLDQDKYEHKDPIMEAWEMKGADKVIPIRISEEK